MEAAAGAATASLRATPTALLLRAWLHRNWRPLPVLASGAAPPVSEPWRIPTGARRAASLVWVEDRPAPPATAPWRAETLRSRGMRRIALVTEAYHMMRAERCFRKQGLETLPAPCGFRTLKFNAGEWLFPGWNPLSYNEAALHEYGGIAVYWLRGWL